MVVPGQRFGRGPVLEEAINSALPDLYGRAVSEAQLEVVGRPEVEVTDLTDGEQLKFTAEVDIRPEFTLPEYKGLEVQVDDAAVDDEQVAEQLESLRKRFGSLVGVERAIEDADFVSLDLEASIDGEVMEDGTATGVSYEVGSGNMVDGLDEAVLGKSAGDTVEFRSTLVGGSHAGDEADIKVVIGSVKTRELPALDDDFAQLASEFDTLDELRESVSARLAKSKKFEQGAQARDKVLEAVLEQLDFPLPAKAVEAEIAWRNEQLDQQIEAAGMTREGFFKLQEQTAEEFAADLDKQVRDGMKAQFVLDKLADAEELSVNQGELTNHLTYIAATCLEDGIATIEPTVDAEEAWVQQLWAAGKGFGRYAAQCTPSYNNAEGERSMAAARNIAHPGNLMNYVAHLERWRDDATRPGTVTTLVEG